MQMGNKPVMKQINVAILGCGTVGTGVARMLLDNGDILKARIGCDLNLKYVADVDTTTDRGITFKPGVMISDAAKAISDPAVDIVVETIGGEGISKKLILDAMGNGKHVVTANKALLAERGTALFELAEANGRDLYFEAAVVTTPFHAEYGFDRPCPGIE